MPVKICQPAVDDNGIFYCTRCDYKTDKKQNWYKHRQTHVGEQLTFFPNCYARCRNQSRKKLKPIEKITLKMTHVCITLGIFLENSNIRKFEIYAHCKIIFVLLYRIPNNMK